MPAPSLSFEFFPPKTLDAAFRLQDSLTALAPLCPDFVSVTYGAGGTTRDLTHEAVTTIGKRTGLDVAAHLTCVDATRDETLEIANRYADAGVTRLVALRGDPPKDARFTPHPGGFADSAELVAALAATGRFDITVGAYPDPHPEAPYAGADIDWLKRKIDAGANRAITQFFFDPETFLRFRDKAVAAGIEADILPGILPVENWSKTVNFARRCGAVIPTEVADAYARAERDDRSELLSIAMATEMCSTLIENGVDHLHFYTLNSPGLTRTVVEALGLAPSDALSEVA